MSIFYKISIDRVNANYISGWCFHRFHRGRPVQLECYQNEKLQAETEASIFREDLKQLGIHPTGKCGFEFITAAHTAFDFSQPLLIRPKGKSAVLADLSMEDWIGPGQFVQRGGWSRRLKKKRNCREQQFSCIFPKRQVPLLTPRPRPCFPKAPPSTISN